MLEAEKIQNIAEIMGIKAEYKPNYKKELIMMKNDGLRCKEIARIVSEKPCVIYSWFSRATRPSDRIIEILENRYLNRKKNV